MSGYTKVPDFAFDQLMRTLTGTEFKICMVIIRKTVGWDKPSDEISTSQFMELTGLSNKPIVESIKSLTERGIISKTRSGQSFSYSLIAKESPRNDSPTYVESTQVDDQSYVESTQVDSLTYVESTQVDDLTYVESTQVPMYKVHRLPPQTYVESTHTIDSIINNDKQGESSSSSEKKENDYAKIARAYENEIGMLTATIADELTHLLDEYPETYVEDAIKEAAKANVRKLSYVQGILKNWRTRGKQDDRKKNTSTIDEIIERQRNELPEYMR